LRQAGRYRVALATAVGAFLAFLAFLVVRPAGDATIRFVANLATGVAPMVAAASCGRAAARATGRSRRAWGLLAGSAASWGVGQAIWFWYEQIVHLELPFPSLADLGYLGAIPLGAVAMLAFPSRAERLALQVRSLLDGGIVAASLLYASWAFVLGPVFRGAEGGLLEQVIALAYPTGDIVLATIVLLVVGRSRRGQVPVVLLGAALLSLTVADTGFAYLTQQGTYYSGMPVDAGWFAGYALIAAAAQRPPGKATEADQTWVDRGQALLPYFPLGLAVATSAVLQLRGQAGDWFLYWNFALLVVLVIGRQLLAVLDNQALNRRLQALVGQLEHQAFHDGLTGLANRVLFHDRVRHALSRRDVAGHPVSLLYIDLDDFKQVNDGLGHDAGDELLVAVAHRLQACVRPEDTVARLGGDEFAILLERAETPEVAAAAARRVLDGLLTPFTLRGSQVVVSASVGVALGAESEIDELLREADVAMYMAKAHGKARFELATGGGPATARTGAAGAGGGARSR
jgi:diguanylate cyclase (GGDEF)-like protein